MSCWQTTTTSATHSCRKDCPRLTRFYRFLFFPRLVLLFFAWCFLECFFFFFFSPIGCNFFKCLTRFLFTNFSIASCFHPSCRSENRASIFASLIVTSPAVYSTPSSFKTMRCDNPKILCNRCETFLQNIQNHL